MGGMGEPTLFHRAMVVIVMVGVVVLGASEAVPSRPWGGDASRSSGSTEGEHCGGIYFGLRFLE